MRPEDRTLLVFIMAVVIVIAGGVALAWLATPQPPFLEGFCGYVGGGTTTAKPTITLTAWAPTLASETISIVGMYPSGGYGASCYSVNLSLNGTAGTASRLPTGANGTVDISFGGSPPPAPGPITVRWTDPDGDGNLSAGDFFTVTRPGGLPSPGAYTFSIVWWDSSTLVYVNFQTP